MTSHRQTGAALVEFHLVATLALLPLLLGILQVALLSVGYHLLSLAAAEAARAGSVDHGRPEGMRRALAEQLMPLVVDLTKVNATGGPADLVAEGLGRAIAEATLFGDIERLSPTPQDFADHARVRNGRRGIPNDALEFRPDAAGRTGGHSVQQANLLRIRVRYCHRLVVPLVDRFLPALLQTLDGDPSHQLCYAAGRVPLRVVTSAPMQSEAWP